MPATQTPCSPEADRFLRSVSVPDPPASPQARKCYWDDTVQEAVGELRRRLASSREAVVTLALLTIVKMETCRMRHGRSVSGTQVSNVNDEWDDLPKLAPLEVLPPPKPETVASIQGIPQVSEPTTAPITPIVAGHEAETPPPPTSGGTGLRAGVPSTGDSPDRGAGATKSEPAPSRSRLVEEKCTFSDRDDDWTRDPARSATPANWQPGPTRAEADAAYDRVVEQQREGFIETSGLYPEDEWPNNPDYVRFRSEPRPHPAFLRFLEWKYGITPPPPPADSG